MTNDEAAEAIHDARADLNVALNHANKGRRWDAAYEIRGVISKLNAIACDLACPVDTPPAGGGADGPTYPDGRTDSEDQE